MGSKSHLSSSQAIVGRGWSVKGPGKDAPKPGAPQVHPTILLRQYVHLRRKVSTLSPLFSPSLFPLLGKNTCPRSAEDEA